MSIEVGKWPRWPVAGGATSLLEAKSELPAPVYMSLRVSVTSSCFARVYTRQWLNALVTFDEMHNLEYVKYNQNYLSTIYQEPRLYDL